MEIAGVHGGAASSVEKLKLTVLVEDSVNVEKADLTAKHGLSFLVETKIQGTDLKILMDAGPPPDIAVQNADTMRTEIRDVNVIVLSHGHYDHVGGLLKVLERVGRQTLIVAHPEAFNPKFAYRPNLKFIGPNFSQSSVKTAGGVMLLARNSVKIANGITTTGEIARETAFEEVKGFWTVEDERFVEDKIMDDQALLVNVRNKGLVVITGCAHAGIINTVKHAQKMVGVKDVYAIIGGVHLEKADGKKVQASVDELVKINPQSIYPCHCTGSKAISRFLSFFGDRCKPIQTGDIVEL
jgi:7,8-dihydropterin-6-yl-methyl-4-(beta-D-ribofuranosyl)aminobenzene 5'-phosphate synthase